jgi:hypothetical protein
MSRGHSQLVPRGNDANPLQPRLDHESAENEALELGNNVALLLVTVVGCDLQLQDIKSLVILRSGDIHSSTIVRISFQSYPIQLQRHRAKPKSESVYCLPGTPRK